MKTPNKKVWIAVATHSNSEEIAIDNLTRQGYINYCPKVMKIRKHARKTENIIKPLFPGYIFVLLDIHTDRWRPIQSTRGIRDIIKFGAQLAHLPDGLIENLKMQEQNGLIPNPIAPPKVDVGDKVTIEGTPLEGHIGTILSVEGNDRICVLLNLLQRSVKTTISVDQLAKH